ncbi:MAG: phosphate ABC transporter permease PstA [Planctomycetota bacterium]
MNVLATEPPPPEPSVPTPRRVSPAGQSKTARGEGQLWLCGGALVLCLMMIAGLLLLVFGEGLATFWPQPLVEVRLLDGQCHLGEPTRIERFTPTSANLDELPAEVRAAAAHRLEQLGGSSARELLRTGNYELSGEHFTWVPEYVVATRTLPDQAMVVERESWGRFYGFPIAYRVDGVDVATATADVDAELTRQHQTVRARSREEKDLRQGALTRLSERQEDARLATRKAMLQHGENSPEHQRATADYERIRVACSEESQGITAKIEALGRENARHGLVLRTIDDKQVTIPVADIVRAYSPNRLGFGDKASLYLSRWREFLTEEPRNSSEGGVWPAIFGTVLMTLLMSLGVVPFGVLAALYLREYARAGLLISAVRIAVNNLAGVPSIVFGVFGLGFFCYVVGGSIDSIFYPERLPSPTFGKGAILWASLTLALLTVPVVIVSTEEALAAVPSSMREGSYACGASKWQTIRRIVLPRAMPGIMTGLILALARGAGEVAPLMLVGAAKLAPALPLDGVAPYLHPSRSFMHLGFHIYDLGFQSPNSEASKPMVFTTTLLLIAIITLLNVVAIWLRNRMRARFVGAQF